jgi:hypothetical protein
MVTSFGYSDCHEQSPGIWRNVREES